MDIINSLLVSSLARTMLPCDLRGYAFLCKMSGCQNVIPKDVFLALLFLTILKSCSLNTALNMIVTMFCE